MSYEYQEYPKFLYHKDKQPMIVKSIEEEIALGDGWYDSPAFMEETLEQSVVIDDIDDADKPKRRGRPPKNPDDETISEE